ncbi:hypothetical protein KY338_05730 [Candidatus Woesearchaeota archaeon]|nr:hypothetical protein [Candidatus Woesearchaeota archaeon]MBW3006446.1 hypothetical protein [Candidatus Woesearchaeota archaeon]
MTEETARKLEREATIRRNFWLKDISVDLEKGRLVRLPDATDVADITEHLKQYGAVIDQNYTLVAVPGIGVNPAALAESRILYGLITDCSERDRNRRKRCPYTGEHIPYIETDKETKKRLDNYVKVEKKVEDIFGED